VVDAVREQCISAIGTTSVSVSHVTIELFKYSCSFQSVFLVGGFARNDWLFSELKSRLQSLRLDLTRPDAHVFVSFNLVEHRIY
jgi:hypothetical protein